MINGPPRTNTTVTRDWKHNSSVSWSFYYKIIHRLQFHFTESIRKLNALYKRKPMNYGSKLECNLFDFVFSHAICWFISWNYVSFCQVVARKRTPILQSSGKSKLLIFNTIFLYYNYIMYTKLCLNCNMVFFFLQTSTLGHVSVAQSLQMNISI